MTTTNETQARKHSVISARILALRADGYTTQAAVDEVLGAGTYEKLVGDLYDALRAKAQR